MKKHSFGSNLVWGVKNKQPNWYTHVANEIANEVGVEKNSITRGHNDERDAYRHAYAIALVTYRYGEGAGKFMGDLNEGKNHLPGGTVYLAKNGWTSITTKKAVRLPKKSKQPEVAKKI